MLDRLLGKDTQPSSGFSSLRQYVSEEGLAPNEHRRRLMLFVLGNTSFATFNQLLDALKDIHGDSDREQLAEIEKRMRSGVCFHCA